MKGSPPLRALLTLGVLLALAWPLFRITQPASAGEHPLGEAAAAEKSAATVANIPLVLNFTRGAERIELRHLGEVVWSKDNPAAREALELNIPFPPEGIELGVQVQWTPGALSALRLQLTTPEGKELERSVWGEEATETIVSFP
jgi:hypothetical protein